MARTLGKLGLTLISLLAIGALTAPLALSQFESEAESSTLSISSNEMQKLGPEEGAYIECTTLKATGTQSGKTTEAITVEPTFSNCETFAGAATTVTWNGCKYAWHLAKGNTTGSADIECAVGKVIEIEVGNICKWTVGTQTGLNSVSYKTLGSGSTRERFVTVHLKGITVVRTTNDFFCPAGGSNWTAFGSGVQTASAGGAHVGIYVD
jgi:hypothetical protein